MITISTKYFGIIIPLTIALLLIPTSMMNSESNLTPSEITRLKKRDALRLTGKSIACNYFVNKQIGQIKQD
jgi:hypothetical protein